MEQVGRVAARAVARSDGTRSTERTADPGTTLTARHTEALWKRFGKLYGLGAMTSKLGSADDGTWLAGMQAAGLGPHDVGVGLQACLQRPTAFPPSLPEFIALCQGRALDGEAREPVRTRLGIGSERQLEHLRQWRPTEAGKQGLRDALAVLGLRSQAETEMGGETA